MSERRKPYGVFKSSKAAMTMLDKLVDKGNHPKYLRIHQKKKP